MECVPKWITFPLSLSLSFFPPILSLHQPFLPHYFFHSTLPISSQLNGLHVSRVWQREMPLCSVPCCSSGLDQSVLLTVHNSNPLPTHLSKPHYQDPPFIRRSASPLYLPPVIREEGRENGQIGFLTLLRPISSALRDRYCSCGSDLKIEPTKKL